MDERFRDARRARPAWHALARRTAGAVIAALAVATVLSGCAAGAAATRPSASAARSFTLGADISALATPGRRRPLPAYQENGTPSDELSILRRHGWDSFRLRVFVSPVRNAPDNSLERMIPLAKRIKDSGALLLLDIHYSDTWADPGHQETPVAWRGLDFEGLERQVETYSRSTIEAFKAAGAMPDWVQVGNEITRGMLWPMAHLKVPGATQTDLPASYDDSTQWDHLTRLLKAGIRGVKAGAGDTPPRIAIHIDKGGDWETSKWFFDHIEAARVPYDIIAQSFYPPWRHGTLEGLWKNMTESARRYDKDFAVVETGYGRSQTPDNPFMLWPTTPEGRLQFMVDVVNTVKKGPRGIAVMYWAPEFDLWNSDGTPGPAVSTLKRLDLTARPASHAPREVHP